MNPEDLSAALWIGSIALVLSVMALGFSIVAICIK